MALHTGTVGFEVRVHDQEPPVDDTFEDIAEVSFRPATDAVQLVEWSAQATYALPLERQDYGKCSMNRVPTGSSNAYHGGRSEHVGGG